ncbi:Calmodulin-binding transcription activator 1, partial [Geodia barretti]
MEVSSRNVSEAPSSAPATSNLFQGYQMQIGEGESALSWQLSSGLTWRKKIWPRVAYPRSLHRWNTVEEILSYLISFESHKQWITTEVPVKPPSGTILFFNRTKTKNYRSDGYDWKTRKSNPSIREDRMKLKVCGMQVGSPNLSLSLPLTLK